jgi:hypothetical protein
MSYTSQSDGNANDWRGARCGAHWRPLEIVAIILGFMLFWPVGLAILALKFWQMKSRHAGDLTSFAQQKAEDVRFACRAWQPRDWNVARDWNVMRGWGGQGGPAGGWNPRRTGNHAFDEWRAAELARLEEERRKLEDAEREFTEHIEELRRARDREEFERFMQARRNRQPPTQA